MRGTRTCLFIVSHSEYWFLYFEELMVGLIYLEPEPHSSLLVHTLWNSAVPPASRPPTFSLQLF